ncbi:MAG TPA: Dam family site-specific DNA-(adenine-N6)-methyltransferase, partial [bacterium]|nr:Dam family site-specific DNA-(adenine-N6)-methyltransferase [bacterium]
KYFYNVRSIDPNELSKVERASRFIFLNKTCYNGLWRVNRKGKFNAPFGSYKTPTILDEDNLLSVSEYLNSAEIIIRSADFSRAIEDTKSGDFIYFDPPYQPISDTAHFTKYNGSGFDEYEQQRLAEDFRCLDNRGCFVMLSNSNTDLINDLYSDYSITVIKANRAINCKGDKRTGATELIVTNY